MLSRLTPGSHSERYRCFHDFTPEINCLQIICCLRKTPNLLRHLPVLTSTHRHGGMVDRGKSSHYLFPPGRSTSEHEQPTKVASGNNLIGNVSPRLGR